MDDISRKGIERARTLFGKSLQQLASSSSELLKPLHTLNETQMVSVQILVHLIHVSLLAKRPQFATNPDTLKVLFRAFDDVCPGLGKDFVASKDPCFDASVAYASALAKCEEDGRDDDDCFETWGPAAESINCAMAEIEEMSGRITGLLKGLEPPWPIPWPID